MIAPDGVDPLLWAWIEADAALPQVVRDDAAPLTCVRCGGDVDLVELATEGCFAAVHADLGPHHHDPEVSSC